MKKLLALILALVMVLGLVACGGNDAPAADAPAADAPAADAPASGVAGDRNGDGKVTVGYANIAETAYQHIAIKEGMEAEAAARGWDFIYMNNELDGQVAVSNATQMLQMGIDYMIEFNVDQSVAPTIMEMMNDANVPVVAIDIIHEGAVYFGVDNYGIGPVTGRYAAELVEDVWGGEIDAMLIVEDPISGEEVLLRTDLIVDGYREVLDLPDDKIYKVDGGVDSTDSQKVVADFLSAHPDMTKVLVCPAHITYRLGASAAIETAGREKDCLIVSQGEYDYLDYIIANPEPPADWEVYRATAVAGFQDYGKGVFEILDKWVAGEEVDQNEVFSPDHYVIDRENVEEHFGRYFEVMGK